jgi:3-phosphoglycerate kinase
MMKTIKDVEISVHEVGVVNQMPHVSTGGGAFLEL